MLNLPHAPRENVKQHEIHWWKFIIFKTPKERHRKKILKGRSQRIKKRHQAEKAK